MKDRNVKQIMAVILGVFGTGITIYMFKVHRDAGIYADETGTSGFTNTAALEWGATFFGFALVLISIILLIKYSTDKK